MLWYQLAKQEKTCTTEEGRIFTAHELLNVVQSYMSNIMVNNKMLYHYTLHIKVKFSITLHTTHDSLLYRPPFNAERLEPVCRLLEGVHDFASFANVQGRGSIPRETLRKIHSVRE